MVRGKYRITDMRNKRFGKLTVISRAENDSCNHAQWLCRCDCGNKQIARGTELRTGVVKSCGCTKRLPAGVAIFNVCYGRYKTNAKRSNREFSISKIDFRKLTSQPCHYCGMPPDQVISKKTLKAKYVYNGLDRADNNKGYTLDNVVPCCKVCNRAKNSMSMEDFLAWLNRIKER